MGRSRTAPSRRWWIGYSLEQATIAYSVFEPQQGHVSQEMLVQRMVDFIFFYIPLLWWNQYYFAVHL